MTATARALAILIGLVACAAAGLLVYSALGKQPLLGRFSQVGLDGPVGGSSEPQIFTIEPGQSASSIGEELQRRGLIRSSLAFRWQVESRGIGSKLGAGDYQLSPSMSTDEIVSVLAKGASRHGIILTIPEGWRAEQLAMHVEELHLGKAQDVVQLVRAPREYGLSPPDP